MQHLFPNPDHNHLNCKTKIMAHAEKFCSDRGLRLTNLRRDVLSVVAAHHKAVGAYQIIENLAETGRDISPISVYRCLDFLLMAGLVHRLNSLNAYFACQSQLWEETEGDSYCNEEAQQHIFLVCDECHTVVEIHEHKFADMISELTSTAQFKGRASQTEINGLCCYCQEKTK